jgi:hypothetical protein
LSSHRRDRSAVKKRTKRKEEVSKDRMRGWKKRHSYAADWMTDEAWATTDEACPAMDETGALTADDAWTTIDEACPAMDETGAARDETGRALKRREDEVNRRRR